MIRPGGPFDRPPPRAPHRLIPNWLAIGIIVITVGLAIGELKDTFDGWRSMKRFTERCIQTHSEERCDRLWAGFQHAIESGEIYRIPTQ